MYDGNDAPIPPPPFQIQLYMAEQQEMMEHLPQESRHGSQGSRVQILDNPEVQCQGIQNYERCSGAINNCYITFNCF